MTKSLFQNLKLEKTINVASIYFNLMYFYFQYNIYRERKSNNIQPYMPSLEERIKIKKEHMSNY